MVSLSKSQIGSNDEDRKTKASETRYFNQAEEEDDDYIPSGSEAASLITESGSLSEDGLSEDDNNNIDGLGKVTLVYKHIQHYEAKFLFTIKLRMIFFFAT